MKTADLKIGDWIVQRNGWVAQLLEQSDEQEDLCVCCMVHGWFTEGGSIYCHDIVAKIEWANDGLETVAEGDRAGMRFRVVAPVRHTQEQTELRTTVTKFFA